MRTEVMLAIITKYGESSGAISAITPLDPTKLSSAISNSRDSLE